jgi:phosphate transport system permease protein
MSDAVRVTLPSAAPDGPDRDPGALQVRSERGTRFRTRLSLRTRLGAVFAVLCLLATLVGVVVLAVLLVDIFRSGAGRLNATFLDGIPSRFPDRAGIKPALVGSAWILVLTGLIGFPLGVGTAIWLEEYAPESRFKRFVETNIANLAGVPSIVYGILGLAVFCP